MLVAFLDFYYVMNCFRDTPVYFKLLCHYNIICIKVKTIIIILNTLYLYQIMQGSMSLLSDLSMEASVDPVVLTASSASLTSHTNVSTFSIVVI